MSFIRLLHRHIFTELISLFSLSLAALLSLVLLGRALQLRDLFLGLNLGLADLVRLFVYLSPFFLVLILPIACMLGVFLTFLRLNTDRELTALRAGGISLYSLVPAPLVFCLLCGALTLGLSLHGLSWGMKGFRTTITELARGRTEIMVRPGVFNTEFPGLTVYARQADVKNGQLKDVIVEDGTTEGLSVVAIAAEGRFSTDPGRGAVVFELKDGRVFREEAESMSLLSFSTYRLRLDLAKLLTGVDLGQVRPKEMSWRELNQAVADPEKTIALRNENFYRKSIVERHKRFVLPFACVILGLFAIPLSCAFSGLDRKWGAMLAAGMFIVYYTVLSIGVSLGETGILAPVFGLWVPHGLFLCAGIYGLRLAERERFGDIASDIRRFSDRLKTRATGGRA